MRVLMYSRSPRDVQAVEQSLSGRGYSLEIANTPEEAANKISADAYDVFLLEWRTHYPNGDIVERLRNESKRPTIVAIVEDVTSATLGSALEAGVDDVQRRPIVACELEHRMRARQVERERPSQKPEPEIGSLFAWWNIDQIARTELGTMLGVEFDSVLPDPNEDWVVAAEIPVVHAKNGMTVRFSIGFDRLSLPRLGHLTLGEGILEGNIAMDLVRETANTIGGAFQHAAASEGAGVTIGLPRDMREGMKLGGAEDGRIFGMRSACGISAILRVELLADRIEHVSPKNLREGMVLTRDIFGINGGLLLSGGTRITEVIAGRLSRILPTHTLVQVAFSG